jgi:hypothetical protein
MICKGAMIWVREDLGCFVVERRTEVVYSICSGLMESIGSCAARVRWSAILGRGRHLQLQRVRQNERCR